MLSTLQSQFKNLEVQRASLLARFAGVEPNLWMSTPSEGAWSLSEIAHHLVLAEREVLHQAHSQSSYRNTRRNIRDRLGAALVGTAFRYGFRVPVPMPSVIPKTGFSYEEIRPAWDEGRAELADYLARITEEP